MAAMALNRTDGYLLWTSYAACRAGIRHTGNVLPPTATRSTSDLAGSASHPGRDRACDSTGRSLSFLPFAPMCPIRN